MARLRIRTSQMVPVPGERSQRRAGTSLEFLEQRAYVPGDDPRLVNWLAYARTGKLYTRIFQAENRGRFYFWCDGSASMSLYGKDRYAQRVSQTLAQIARAEGAYSLGPEGPRPFTGQVSPDPRGPLAGIPALAAGVRGTLVVISDGLDAGDWNVFLKRLYRIPLVFIQILAPEELNPLAQDAELVDVETGARLTIDARAAGLYQRRLEAHIRLLRSLTQRRGYYGFLRPEEPITARLWQQKVLEEA